MNYKEFQKNIFKKFESIPDKESLPQKFTYPFNYEPHPLCIQAASKLQQYIASRKDWEYDFGINNRDESVYGKMFGILVVENSFNEVGWIAAYSGKLAGRNDHKGFVPPIVDLLQKDGFYRTGEAEIIEINQTINQLENNPQFTELKRIYKQDIKASTEILHYLKQDFNNTKKKRKAIRETAKDEMTEKEFEKLFQIHKRQSLKIQYHIKKLKHWWKKHLLNMENQIKEKEDEIILLKKLRKDKSRNLQKEIFKQFSFLNYKKQKKSLYDIFYDFNKVIPPAGAGDCAAPKLLQYAYENNLKPLTMAEFWWGKSPFSIIRKHAHYYPSCRNKCEPILKHMLEGLNVEDDPMKKSQYLSENFETVYEDEDIILINKPAGLLSVPGKKVTDSVLTRLKNKYPDDNIYLVHRLDMSTSGLLLAAKNETAYKVLQKQFIERSTVKRYIALLENELYEQSGTIDLPLRVDLDNRPSQMVCFEYGKKAVTEWRLIKNVNRQAKVEFTLKTGRTHQLRVHSAHPLGLNNPITGDDIYGKRGIRLCLHSAYLEFTHPKSMKRISFESKADF